MPNNYIVADKTTTFLADKLQLKPRSLTLGKECVGDYNVSYNLPPAFIFGFTIIEFPFLKEKYLQIFLILFYDVAFKTDLRLICYHHIILFT